MDSPTRERFGILCPGQGAQAVGMGRAWRDASPAARAVFDGADRLLRTIWGDRHDGALTDRCFNGPAEILNRTDISQPAIFVTSVASWRGWQEANPDAADADVPAAAGLSLGEYTALHLAGVFDFETALELVALRGELMQEAAEATDGGMVALVGADEEQARTICDEAAGDWVLVPANFNAPGQIVLSGRRAACDVAVEVARRMGLRAQPLKVAGAFHSPLMQPAADGLERALGRVDLQKPAFPVWSNVTAEPHDADDAELLRRRLVEQVVAPVRWSDLCRNVTSVYRMPYHEPAPGSVLRGLMRRIDRDIEVISHDEPAKES